MNFSKIFSCIGIIGCLAFLANSAYAQAPLVSGHTYVVSNELSGMALDNTGWSTTHGTFVEQWDNWGGPPQQWILTNVGNDNWTIVNAYSGMALDDTGWGTTNGIRVEQWDNWGGPPQQWKIIPVGDGTYKVISAYANLALDNYNWSTTHGTPIVLWQDFNAVNQHWRFHDIANRTFTYQNPLPRGVIDGVRDPYILNVDGVWYMTGTAKPFFPEDYGKFGPPPGVPLYSSSDLKNWTFRGTIVPRIAGTWYQDRFWAPEIHVKNTPSGRKFYCTFNCGNVQTNGPHGVGLAVANDIAGPYTVLTPNQPLIIGNDANIFTDDDGTDYLFIANIGAIQIDLANAHTVGAYWSVINPGGAADWDGGNGVGIEGPQVIKIKGIYYCFYSSWGRGYEVGYATATNIHGPWTKYSGNPIYGAQDPGIAAHYGHTYTQSPNVPYREVGHGQPFIGPDGRWWISAHMGLKNPAPDTTQYIGWEQPGYDPLNFQNGVFLPGTPTWTSQTVAIP